MQHGEIFHGSSTTVPCPSGYNGSVTFACNDADLTLVRGKCGKRCGAGVIPYKLQDEDPYAAVLGFPLEYPDMDDGDSFSSQCPSSLVGTVQLKCQDGAVLLRQDQSLPWQVFFFCLQALRILLVYCSFFTNGFLATDF